MTYKAGPQYTEISLDNESPIMKLTPLYELIMGSTAIMQYIADRKLTLKQAMELTAVQSRSLESTEIRQDIAEGRLTFEQAMGLTFEQYCRLTSVKIRQDITEGRLTSEQAMGLTYIQYWSLTSPEIRKDIAEGRLTSEQAMGLTFEQCWSLTSAKIRSYIAEEKLTFEQAMGFTFETFSKLASTDVRRLLDNNIITFDNVLALTKDQCFLLEEPRIYTSLYHGTLNIVDFMAGRYPQIYLGIIIREEAINYIAALSSPSNSNQVIGITDLLTRVSNDGAAAIWDKIKPNVTARMFSEFGSLYKNDLNNPEFVALIDTGKNLKLENLPSFQEAVAKSPGYREWCSDLLNKNGFFASSGAAKKTGQEIVKWQEAPVNSTI